MIQSVERVRVYGSLRSVHQWQVSVTFSEAVVVLWADVIPIDEGLK